MKKLLLLFITISFVLSQNIVGDVVGRYTDGAIREIEYYQRVDNKIFKIKTEQYYENGQIKSEENYTDGKLDSNWLIYRKDGEIQEEKIYIDGEMIGWRVISSRGEVHVFKGSDSDFMKIKQ